MKTTLFSTVSAAALLAFAAPAFADDDFTGVAQFSIGRGSADGTIFFSGKGLDDPTFYGGEARGLWPLSPDVHFQADLFVQQSDNVVRNWGSSDDATEFGGAVHLLHPFENRARFGLAGSVWSNDVFVPVGNGRADATYGLGALEAQVFGADWTLMAQAGLFDQFNCSNSCPFALNDGTFLRGGIRYYLHDNTVLSLEGLQMWGSPDDAIFGGKSINLNATQWKLAAEHRFENSQYSLFVSLGHESTESFLFSSNTETTTGSIGVKFYFNRPSLHENDRSGAQLDTPRFGDTPEIAAPAIFGGLSGP